MRQEEEGELRYDMRVKCKMREMIELYMYGCVICMFADADALPSLRILMQLPDSQVSSLLGGFRQWEESVGDLVLSLK